MEENIYTPESKLKKPKQLLYNMFFDLWLGRQLAWRLFIRDLKAQYRQTFLGLLWIFLPAIGTTAAFVLFNRSKLFNTPEEMLIPYPVFVLVGTICWQTFAEALISPLRILTVSGKMIVKINFPREALICSAMLQSAFNSGVRLVLIIPIFLYYDITPYVSGLCSIFPLFVLLLMGSVAGVIIAPFGVLYQDIEKSLPMILNFWMLLTPVVYLMPSEGLLSKIVKYNPVTPIIITSRNWILSGIGTPDPNFWYVFFITILFIFIGWLIFRLSLPILIERMQA